jgi:hypothetical protein
MYDSAMRCILAEVLDKNGKLSDTTECVIILRVVRKM